MCYQKMLPNFLKKQGLEASKSTLKNEQKKKKKILTEQPDETQIKKKVR